MSDYDEARQEAMNEALNEHSGEYIEQGKNEMRETIIDIIDKMISDAQTSSCQHINTYMVSLLFSVSESMSWDGYIRALSTLKKDILDL